MKGYLSCQAREVLPTSGYIFRRSARRTAIAAQDLIAVEVIHSLLHGGEGVQCYTVELGDEIMAYSPALPEPGSTAPTPAVPDAASDLYLVAAGTVRLLAENPGLQKTVSVAKLGPGQGFGCDRPSSALWSASWGESLAYRAVAAAPGQIVRVSAPALAAVLGRWPGLGSQLQRQFQRRSPLAFFKQCTPLGTVPSTTLKRQLLPRLVEQSLPAGTPLAPDLHAATDCLWLRQGQMVSAADPQRILAVGDRWGYPDSGGDWVAQTDSLLYRLPLAPWEVEETRRLG